MIYLLIGIFLFLGAHSVRIWADPWRERMLERLGDARWKGLYALTSAIGLGLLIWGFGLARQEPVQLWSPPNGMRHLAAVLMLGSFVLLAAAYVPGNRIKARLRHPMVLSVKLWALAHLLANGNLAHGVLFGAFWSGRCSAFAPPGNVTVWLAWVLTLAAPAPPVWPWRLVWRPGWLSPCTCTAC